MSNSLEETIIETFKKNNSATDAAVRFVTEAEVAE
jgi:hypothetical protein